MPKSTSWQYPLIDLVQPPGAMQSKLNLSPSNISEKYLKAVSCKDPFPNHPQCLELFLISHHPGQPSLPVLEVLLQEHSTFGFTDSEKVTPLIDLFIEDFAFLTVDISHCCYDSLTVAAYPIMLCPYFFPSPDFIVLGDASCFFCGDVIHITWFIKSWIWQGLVRQLPGTFQTHAMDGSPPAVLACKTTTSIPLLEHHLLHDHTLNVAFLKLLITFGKKSL